MKFLYYTRPSQHTLYSEIFKKSEILSSSNIFYLTEVYNQYSKIKNKVPSYFLDIEKKVDKDKLSFFSETEIDEIISRDRYLRSIKQGKALKYISNVTGQLLLLYSKVEPDLVSSHIVDGFTIDIFHRIAQKKDIPTFSPVWNGFGNTCKFYERNKVIERSSPLSEVSLKEAMSKKRIDETNPDISKKSLYQRIYNVYKAKKALLRNLAKSGYIQGKTSIHLLFRQSKTSAIPQLNLRDLVPGYFDDLNTIDYSVDKPIVYISCHLTPEATIDYFTDDRSLIDHDNIILEILKQYNNECQFIVKEHPVMYNKRSLDFYDQIKKISNCYLVDPSLPYFQVLEKVDVVMSWGGSVGYEAPFFGVKTLNVGKPYYHIDGYENYFVDRKDLFENFSDKLNSLSYSDEDYADELDSKFKYLLFPGIMHQEIGNDPENISELANSIDYLIREILFDTKVNV